MTSIPIQMQNYLFVMSKKKKKTEDSVILPLNSQLKPNKTSKSTVAG